MNFNKITLIVIILTIGLLLAGCTTVDSNIKQNTEDSGTELELKDTNSEITGNFFDCGTATSQMDYENIPPEDVSALNCGFDKFNSKQNFKMDLFNKGIEGYLEESTSKLSISFNENSALAVLDDTEKIYSCTYPNNVVELILREMNSYDLPKEANGLILVIGFEMMNSFSDEGINEMEDTTNGNILTYTCTIE